MRARNELEWFWSQFRKYYSDEVGREAICQCETESLISKCDDAQRMRGLLLTCFAIEQAERRVPELDHESFRTAFRLPRLRSHVDFIDPTEPSPDWVIYEYHGYHRKMDWSRTAEIADTLLCAIHAWFDIDPVRARAWPNLVARLNWLPTRIAQYDREAAATVAEALGLSR